jgi:23S rRNA pseudouridine955/2504/2580 synthase
MKKIRFEDIIIGEDEGYIVVNKPPFIATLEDRNDPINLLKLAKQYHPELQACHRLDKETSGVLVFAKNPDSYRNLSIQFEKREVLKIYHAIVGGMHDIKEDVVDVPLHTLNKGVVRVDFSEGKDALTVIKTLEVFQHHTLMACFPLTGRMHQIRVHLAWKKAPIAGDELYGGEPIFLSKYKRNYKVKNWEEEQPMIKRVALHARSIRYRLPDGTEKHWEAPYPKDFEVAVNQLRKFSK